MTSEWDYIEKLKRRRGEMCKINHIQYSAVIDKKSVDDRPPPDPKGELLAPKNKFQIAFGDAYCMACICMKHSSVTTLVILKESRFEVKSHLEQDCTFQFETVKRRQETAIPKLPYLTISRRDP